MLSVIAALLVIATGLRQRRSTRSMRAEQRCAVEMIGVDIVEVGAIKHGNGGVTQPDILTLGCAGGGMLGNDMAEVKDGAFAYVPSV